MLYVVATPIGNLDDLSIRQAKILTASDIILAEDTRSATKLLNTIKLRFGFRQQKHLILRSFYKEKEYQETFRVIKELESGKIITLISESGMPLISDPGHQLIKEVIKRNIDFTVIPGPTALTTAIIHSGFDTSNFMFMGFLPKKHSELKKIINKMIKVSKLEEATCFVVYASKFQYINIMKLFKEIIPEADICVCREMTKKFEEVIRGKPKDLKNKKLKGEITMVIKLVNPQNSLT